MNNSIDESMNIYFEIEYKRNGKKRTKQLTKDGDKIKVLDNNKKKYVFRLIAFLTYVKYKRAIDNLIDGFHSIIPLKLL